MRKKTGVTDTSEWPLTTAKTKYHNLCKVNKVKNYKPKKYLTTNLFFKKNLDMSNILNEFWNFGKFKPLCSFWLSSYKKVCSKQDKQRGRVLFRFLICLIKIRILIKNWIAHKNSKSRNKTITSHLARWYSWFSVITITGYTHMLLYW